MNIGDLLEWVGGGLLVAAGAIYVGLPLALLAAGVVLLYEAQCMASVNLPWFIRRKRKSEEPG